jgi:predicted ferric reductase
VLEPHTGRNSLQKHGEELKEREFAFCASISLAEMVRRNMEKN